MAQNKTTENELSVTDFINTYQLKPNAQIVLPYRTL